MTVSFPVLCNCLPSFFALLSCSYPIGSYLLKAKLVIEAWWPCSTASCLSVLAFHSLIVKSEEPARQFNFMWETRWEQEDTSCMEAGDMMRGNSMVRDEPRPSDMSPEANSSGFLGLKAKHEIALACPF